jgi:hypothetical protein
MQYTTDQQWVGGTKAQTVAGDAKNGSPISAVAFAINGTQQVGYAWVTVYYQVYRLTVIVPHLLH